MSFPRPIQEINGVQVYIRDGSILRWCCPDCGWWNDAEKACEKCGRGVWRQEQDVMTERNHSEETRPVDRSGAATVSRSLAAAAGVPCDHRLICGTCGEMGEVRRLEGGRYCVSAQREGKVCCQTRPRQSAEAAVGDWEQLTGED